jgi:hypothetical protein
MNMSTENEIYPPEMSKNVLELLRVAHEYCLFAENADRKDPGEISDFFRKIGPLLYLKGLLLPVVDPEYPEADERFVTEEEWQAILNGFRSRFLRQDEFWHIDHENGIEYEPIKASLSENFADIYQDLKDFLLLYQKNTRDARQNAVSDCRRLFESRWGIKTLSNMRYLHYLQNKPLIDMQEDYF